MKLYKIYFGKEFIIMPALSPSIAIEKAKKKRLSRRQNINYTDIVQLVEEEQ